MRSHISAASGSERAHAGGDTASAEIASGSAAKAAFSTASASLCFANRGVKAAGEV